MITDHQHLFSVSTAAVIHRPADPHLLHINPRPTYLLAHRYTLQIAVWHYCYTYLSWTEYDIILLILNIISF